MASRWRRSRTWAYTTRRDAIPASLSGLTYPLTLILGCLPLDLGRRRSLPLNLGEAGALRLATCPWSLREPYVVDADDLGDGGFRGLLEEVGTPSGAAGEGGAFGTRRRTSVS